jgi:hypothetical protein
MGFFEGIEQLAFVQLLKSSFIVYPILNALHIASIGTLFASVLLLDLGILGFFRPPGEGAFLKFMRRVALIGFACAVLTGLFLFSIRASEYVQLRVFQLKLALIVLAGINLVVFTRLERSRAQGALRWSAALSLALWSGALLCGRFIGFV